MSIIWKIKEAAAKAIEALYGQPVAAAEITVSETKPEFEGDYTVVLFQFVKRLRTSPDALGQALGRYLTENNKDLFTGFNLIKGFLNLTVTDDFFLGYLQQQYNKEPSLKSTTSQKIMVEYSSPNTNKPLHLGHLRNNFLGWSIAEILKASGNEVKKNLYCKRPRHSYLQKHDCLGKVCRRRHA